MSNNLAVYKNKVNTCESNLKTIASQIDELEKNIKLIINALKSDDEVLLNEISLSQFLDDNFQENIINYEIDSDDVRFFNYSVDRSNLSHVDNVDFNGKSIPVYSSSSSSALYVICDGMNSTQQKQLMISLKGKLSNNQVAIVTYNNELYHYDINDKNGCTKEYTLVGKNESGKMFAFETNKNSNVVVDGGTKNQNLLVSVNGFVVDNDATLYMETDMKLPIKTYYRQDIKGYDEVDGLARLTLQFESKGYGDIYDDNGYSKLLTQGNQNSTRPKIVLFHDKENVKKDENNYVYKDENGNYASNVAGLTDYSIPTTIETASKTGNVSISFTTQGAKKNNYGKINVFKKEMIGFSARIVDDWGKIV